MLPEDIVFGAAFPAALCVYLVVRIEKTIEANTKAILDLKSVIGNTKEAN